MIFFNHEIMYEIIKRLSNWFKIIKNKKWKYNIIDKNWKILFKQ